MFMNTCSLFTVQGAFQIGLNTPGKHVVVNLCGRGDKDMHSVAKAMGVTLHNNA